MSYNDFVVVVESHRNASNSSFNSRIYTRARKRDDDDESQKFIPCQQNIWPPSSLCDIKLPLPNDDVFLSLLLYCDVCKQQQPKLYFLFFFGLDEVTSFRAGR